MYNASVRHPTLFTMTRAEHLTLWTAGLGVLHHIDHVLRTDHSGWPFKADVTPFTFSLLIYLVIALLLALRGYPRVRVTLAAIVFLVPTSAHLFLETLFDQYRTWAHGHEINLLGTDSAVLGGAAVTVSVVLSVIAFLALLAFWREASARP